MTAVQACNQPAAVTTVAAGRSTYLLGQTAHASLTGGDVVVDAGTGISNGRVVIGPNANSVSIGLVGKTTTVNGHFTAAGNAGVSGIVTANHLTVSGVLSSTGATIAGVVTSAGITSSQAVTASHVSVSGFVTSGGMTTSGALSVDGSSRLTGTLQLGGNTKYTIGRPINAGTNGESTYLIGQSGLNGNGRGGDVVIEVGAGDTTGVVRIGLTSEAITLSQASKTTLVRGALLANSLSVSSLMTAQSLSLTQDLTARNLQTTAAATIASTLTVGGAISAAGVFTGPVTATAVSVGHAVCWWLAVSLVAQLGTGAYACRPSAGVAAGASAVGLQSGHRWQHVHRCRYWYHEWQPDSGRRCRSADWRQPDHHCPRCIGCQCGCRHRSDHLERSAELRPCHRNAPDCRYPFCGHWYRLWWRSNGNRRTEWPNYCLVVDRVWHSVCQRHHILGIGHRSLRYIGRPSDCHRHLPACW